MASQPVQNDPILPEQSPFRPSRWRRVRAWASRTWLRLQPGPRARRGAAWGAVLGAALAVGVVGRWFRLGVGPLLDVPAGILTAWLFVALCGLGLILGLKLLSLF